MKSEWNIGTISEVCSLVTDGSHYSPKSCDSGEYMVSVKDFKGFGFDFSNCKHISSDDYEKMKASGCIPEHDDILIGKDGARFFEDIIIYNQPEKPALLSSIAILRCNPAIILPQFLYYICRNPIFKKDVRDNYGSGSAIPRIVLKDFKRMTISYPDLAEQRRIVASLVAIDDRIALNTAINENLEQQAQALFKAWFVDFEPFGGIMPDDWTETTLGTIAAISTKSINPLKQPDLYLEHYSIPAYDEQHYPIFEYASEIKSNKYILTNNSVMISKLNPDTKRIWRPLCLSANPVCSTEFIVYEAVNPKYKDYIYSLIDSQAFSDYLCAHTTGSTNSRQRATPKTTLDYTCIMPSDDIITRFCGIVTPMYDQIASNIIESQRLAALRDTLLPKLMNGEIDVSAVRI